MAFILEAERRELLPLGSSRYAEVAVGRHGTMDPGRLAALQDLLIAGDASIGLPSFRGTLLDPAMGGRWKPIPLEDVVQALEATGNWNLHGVGTWHQAKLAAVRQRKAQGSFFTPGAIARDVLTRALGGLGDRPALLDPAMGCGAFLVEALDRLDRGERTEVALACLHGVDRDPVAVGLARLGLWLAIGDRTLDPSRLFANLQVANSLAEPGCPLPDPALDWPRAFPGPMAAGGFDAVVGNPPYVNIERLDERERSWLRSRYPTMRKRFDLYVGMTERALELTRPGGRVGLVLPEAFLTQDYAEQLRRHLVTGTTIHSIATHPPFAGASVRTVSVVAERTPASPDHAALIDDHAIPQALLARMPGVLLRRDRSASELESALERLETGIPLGRVAIATWGVRGVPIRQFHLDLAEGPEDRPMLKGDCLRRGVLRWKGKFLRYRPRELYRPLFPELFEQPKLVVAKVTGDRGLEIALDTEGYYCDDSLICLQPKYQLADLAPEVIRRHRLDLSPEDVDLSRRYPPERLLEILQGPETRQVFDILFGTGLNVYPEAVRQIPLPP